MPLSMGRKPSSEELLTSYSLPINSPPPYYEAGAYPKVRSRRLRKVFSLPVGLALLSASFSAWLCVLLVRQTSSWTAAQTATAQVHLTQFQRSLDQCAALRKVPARVLPAERKTNPRWNDATGQSVAIVLRNATLFDGQVFVPEPVDVVFEKGVIVSVSKTGSQTKWAKVAQEYDLRGLWVTPGLVDMHSHHGVGPWPETEGAGDDSNEMHPDFGPLTPFVRAIDSLKAYDVATTLIASGGVTTSLIIPGSANIMGGEGTVVKNRLLSGRNKELVVEELLLEHGIPFDERHRYMKMACGENPKAVYGHTRMGNAWVLRKHLARAKELLEKQDAWCTAAARVQSSDVETQRHFLEQMGGGFPEELELESTVGMLRGRVAMHNHCYEPEDFETMLRISKEFGFRVRAFHHAISAWRVPEMLKEYGENVTIATFAEWSLYKMEAYDASLYAGRILNEHGVAVAYKSDHSGMPTNAKYLLSQAAAAHSFQLPADIALQAVTSVPAKAIDVDDRVGYVRTGYDADIVVWDSHPLSVGATPRQVFIDGVATLDPVKVKESIDDAAVKSAATRIGLAAEPRMRAVVAEEVKEDFCRQAGRKGQGFVINGIKESFLETHSEMAMHTGSQETSSNLTLVISNGKIDCFGSSTTCTSQIAAAYDSGASTLNLANGYLAPGLTAVSTTLGLKEVQLEEVTGNGALSPSLAPKRENVDFAKYGLTLDGKSFARARMGGVTRAITPPLSNGGLMRGISAGFLTSGKRKIVNGGIFRGSVAAHVDLGQLTRVSPGSRSFAIKQLRQMLGLLESTASSGEAVLASALQGQALIVIHAESQHDIEQVILMKRDLGEHSLAKIVIHGGHEASHVAKELAEANIPVILTAHRGSGIHEWDARNTLPGPPLSRSPANVLSDAGVLYAIAFDGSPPEAESRIHALALEASWAAKYAGLSDREAIKLVSRNVESILDLDPSGDIVIWEGNPLQFGARPELAFQDVEGGVLELATCFPDETDSE